MYRKYSHLREMIEECAVKYENNIAFKLKKTDENKKVYYDEVTYSRFRNEIEYLASGRSILFTTIIILWLSSRAFWRTNLV